jgi:hypothetical protein
MRSVIVVAAIVILAASSAAQIQERHARYMDRAEVRHSANSASVVANSPRPLAQAITALSEEYAWVIDFEDPPYYSRHDLVDDTAPQWRASHPNAKGVTAVSGDSFESQYPETGPSTWKALRLE